MDEFLARVHESISVVDAQLDFEDLMSRINRTKYSPESFSSMTNQVESYVESHSLSDIQILKLVTIFAARLDAPESAKMTTEVFELLWSIVNHVSKISAGMVELYMGEIGLLKYLNNNDLYCKYYAVLILRKLLSCPGGRVGRYLLGTPEIMGDLVDMARSEETSEFLRNEVITLLFKLTADTHHTELRSILVYQGLAEIIFELLIDDEDGTLPTLSTEAIDCLDRLCRNGQSSRYIRESGGCDKIAEYIEYAMSPVIDHASGVSSEEDPETLQKRIDSGWDLSEKVLHVAELLLDQTNGEIYITNGLVRTLCTCGESLFLSDSARAICYQFIASLITEKMAQDFVDYDDAHLPLLWTLFVQLIDERTPLPVRGALDSVVYHVCKQSGEAQQKLVSMLGSPSPEEFQDDDDDDPMNYYISQSPGRIVSSVLSHASNQFLESTIPQDSALAQQVWFSLRAVSHFVRGSVDLQRSVLNVRLNEQCTFGELVVKLAKSDNGVIMSAAISVICEFLSGGGSNVLASTMMSDLEYIRFLIENVKKSDSKFAPFLLSLLISLSGESNGSAEVLIHSVELPKLHKTVEQLVNEKSKSVLLKLPASMPVGFDECVARIGPSVNKGLLERYLASSSGKLETADCRDALLKQQQERIALLETELAAAKSDLTDVSVSLNASAGQEFIVKENLSLWSVLRQLQKELQIVNDENEVLRKMNTTDSQTYRKIIEELHAQVAALALNNKQLTELDRDAYISAENLELIELLEKIYTNFPETHSLIGPLR